MEQERHKVKDNLSALLSQMKEIMEQELFDYKNGWDGDQECMVFYNCQLKVQIGDYAPGTVIDSICICNGVLQFFKHEQTEPIAQWKLHYKVGNPIISEAEKNSA